MITYNDGSGNKANIQGKLENHFGKILGDYQVREKGKHCFGPKGVILGSIDDSKLLKLCTYRNGSCLSTLEGSISTNTSSLKVHGTNGDGIAVTWLLKVTDPACSADIDGNLSS